MLAAAERSLAAGAAGLSLADTIGTATPREVTDLVAATKRLAGDVPVGAHLHDTRGLGVANALAAIDAGVDRIDGTVGGLGGCPFAPGASGNLALEDLVHVLEESGVDTGIDLEALIDAAHLACGLAGRPSRATWPRPAAASRSLAELPMTMAAVAWRAARHAYARAARRRSSRVATRRASGWSSSAIAAELGLSRTPVREALRMLEAEGLVVSERNRGAMVRPLSSTEVEDLYGLRIRLECYAVELATERATETELGALVEAADAFGAIAAAVDVDQRRRHPRCSTRRTGRFHDGILEAARHRRLTTMLARTVDIPLVFQAFRSFGAAEIERSDTFHHLIVEAMCRRDGARAAGLMAEHIAQGRDAVLDALATHDLSAASRYPGDGRVDPEHGAQGVEVGPSRTRCGCRWRRRRGRG